jgi:ribosome recycling factor
MAEKGQSRVATTSPSSSLATKAGGAPAERRKRVALRRLIDEMLAEIRAAASEENWTADARAQAEADLARIMDQVRREAMREDSRPKAKRAKPAR